MYITRLEAINIAISAIKQQEPSNKNQQAIFRLEKMKRQNSFIQWTKEEVIKRLDDWKEQHKRNPTVTNLIEPDMPKPITIQKLFDMKASAFLNIYYPMKKRRANTTKYNFKTKEEWIQDFIEQYNKILPSTQKDYNTKRDKSSPTWNTIVRYCGFNNWNELIRFTKVNTNKIKTKVVYQNSNVIIVNTDIPLYKEYETLIENE